MNTYMTKQRMELLQLLRSNHDEHFSAKDIARRVNFSISAVYRNLKYLEDDGKIERVTKSNSREVYYRFLDTSCIGNIHMFCINCKNMTHLNKDLSLKIVDEIKNIEFFNVNQNKTVLYGLCSNCENKEI